MFNNLGEVFDYLENNDDITGMEVSDSFSLEFDYEEDGLRSFCEVDREGGDITIDKNNIIVDWKLYVY